MYQPCSQHRITDAHGNLVTQQEVVFAVDNGGTPGSQTVKTNEQGEATLAFSNTSAGVTVVQASINGAGQSVETTFVADKDNLDTERSTLKAEPETIVANGSDESTITLTLKDANSNPVSGQTVAFKSSLVGITLGEVADQRDGTYTATLSGKQLGQASITAQVNGTDFAVAATTVTLTAGAPVAINSTLKASEHTIVADGTTQSTLTLTLKDSNNNPVPGQAITTGTLTGSAATGAKVGSWTAGSDGVYTAPLTGTQVGTVTVLPQVNGGNAVTQGATVTLTPYCTGILVNGETFALNAKFPSTGFVKAAFQMQVPGTASDFNWSADQPWVTVDNAGKVTFTGTASSTTNTVAITATPKEGGKPLVYTFTVQKWFTNNGDTSMNWSNAGAYCRAQAQIQPPIANVSNGAGKRVIGSLWGEWGSLVAGSYTGAGFLSVFYWASDTGSGGHYSFGANDGTISSNSDSTPLRVVCQKNL